MKTIRDLEERLAYLKEQAKLEKITFYLSPRPFGKQTTVTLFRSECGNWSYIWDGHITHYAGGEPGWYGSPGEAIRSALNCYIWGAVKSVTLWDVVRGWFRKK